MILLQHLMLSFTMLFSLFCALGAHGYTYSVLDQFKTPVSGSLEGWVLRELDNVTLSDCANQCVAGQAHKQCKAFTYTTTSICYIDGHVTSEQFPLKHRSSSDYKYYERCLNYHDCKCKGTVLHHRESNGCYWCSCPTPAPMTSASTSLNDGFGDDALPELPSASTDSASTSTESPSTESASTDMPSTSTESPSTESPSTESTSTESSTTESPSTESTSTESPSTESSTTDMPSTESPSTESTSTESSTTDMPSTDSSTSKEVVTSTALLSSLTASTSSVSVILETSTLGAEVGTPAANVNGGDTSKTRNLTPLWIVLGVTIALLCGGVYVMKRSRPNQDLHFSSSNSFSNPLYSHPDNVPDDIKVNNGEESLA